MENGKQLVGFDYGLLDFIRVDHVDDCVRSSLCETYVDCSRGSGVVGVQQPVLLAGDLEGHERHHFKKENILLDTNILLGC